MLSIFLWVYWLLLYLLWGKAFSDWKKIFFKKCHFKLNAQITSICYIFLSSEFSWRGPRDSVLACERHAELLGRGPADIMAPPTPTLNHLPPNVCHMREWTPDLFKHLYSDLYSCSQMWFLPASQLHGDSITPSFPFILFSLSLVHLSITETCALPSTFIRQNRLAKSVS